MTRSTSLTPHEKGRDARIATVIVGLSLFALAGASGCRSPEITPAGLAARAGMMEVLQAPDADRISRHVDVLASDSFGGRRPGTEGEVRTLDYIVGEVSSYGLASGLVEDYRQRFALEAYDVSFTGRIGPDVLNYGEDIVASPWKAPNVTWDNTPVVFGGYGLESDLHKRDDYAGVDVEGAIVLVFGGPPPGADSLGSISGYGRKQDTIGARGAVGMIVLWDEEEFTWSDTRLYYMSPFFGRMAAGKLPVLETNESLGRRMLAQVGLTLEQARLEASHPSFRARSLPWTFSGRLTTERHEMVSHNVVAEIAGSDEALANEWIVLTAHWDHLGTDTTLTGDRIFNGAMDNATGSATLLEVARALSLLPGAPSRGIRFVWTGAEEFGLHGAKAYLVKSMQADERTVATINFDFQNPFGPANDIVILGRGNTTLEDGLESVARWQGRVVSDDPWPEEGFYLRSDHFEFAKAGVPALFPASGVDLIAGGRERGLRLNAEMFAQNMHKVSDEVGADWDYAGVVEDAQALLMLTMLASESTAPPRWKVTTAYPEFAALNVFASDSLPVIPPLPAHPPTSQPAPPTKSQ